jgi:hypothetical protein
MDFQLHHEGLIRGNRVPLSMLSRMRDQTDGGRARS